MSRRSQLPESSLTDLRSQSKWDKIVCRFDVSQTGKEYTDVNRKWPHIFLMRVWKGRKFSSSCWQHAQVHSRPRGKAALPRQWQLSTHIERSEVTQPREHEARKNNQWTAINTSPSDWCSQSRSRSWIKRSPRGLFSPVQSQHRYHTPHNTLVVVLCAVLWMIQCVVAYSKQ